MVRIYKLSTGDDVHRYERSVVLQFKGKRKVLSTSPFNGGYQENLKYVFNHDGNIGAGVPCKMKAPTYEEHMRIIAEEIGLDPDSCAGLSTAAHMENLSIQSETYEDFTVTALVTGGIEVNGGRVGDVASYDEKQGKATKVKEGTINIILVIDADLPAGTMARALVTCTEAKTAAIQELMLDSRYSRGIATGSGTDGTIVVCNSESEIKLTNAGKHSKLGEYIGRVVKKAVKEALYLQTGVCADMQYSMLRRMRRFGVTEDSIWRCYEKIYESHMKDKDKAKMTIPEFMHNVHILDKNSKIITFTTMYAHLIDEYDWDLIKSEDVISGCNMILENIRNWKEEHGQASPHHGYIKCSSKDKEELIKGIIDAFVVTVAFSAGREAYV
ncbi:Adenosylcobinamide amidohydrolase [Hathewaya proteolytica DSM 3090]|uniref:Adenosylcobinamide amidohydrolase n=2 Tax=Hathewaya proteolytica TaxID=29365 RepID=A0A1M6KMV1_9CLOT|nr:Adenosylcobinamide amidohydrolase [Hathewaya proteolytica DSM 3090]